MKIEETSYKDLLDKYYEGETSPAEELQLESLIFQSKAPTPEKDLFDYFESEKQIELGGDFDEKLFAKIKFSQENQKAGEQNFNDFTPKQSTEPNPEKKAVFYRYAYLAAASLVLIFASVLYFSQSNKKEISSVNKTLITQTQTLENPEQQQELAKSQKENDLVKIDDNNLQKSSKNFFNKERGLVITDENLGSQNKIALKKTQEAFALIAASFDEADENLDKLEYINSSSEIINFLNTFNE